jgi:DNA-directed RNA polymerase sigma subunit (sigma70/sigma32)
MTPDDVRYLLQLARHSISLSTPIIPGEDETTLEGTIADEISDQKEVTIERKHTVERIIGQLTNFHSKVAICLLFGLTPTTDALADVARFFLEYDVPLNHPHTPEEIATLFRMSPGKVSVYIRRGIEDLKPLFEEAQITAAF